MTEEIVKFYFRKFFKNNDAFQKAMINNYLLALKKCYKYKEEDGTPRTKAPSPGWGGSPHTPLTFIQEGKERFLKELKEFPQKTKYQIISTTKKYFSKEDEEIIKLAK